MKIIVIALFFLNSYFIFSQVGIGTTTPDVSAALDVSATNAGFLMPRLTTTERNSITNPAKGLLLFNTSSNSLELNIGNAEIPIWTVIGSSVNSSQSGSYNVDTTSSGWNYFDVIFANEFPSIPSIQLTFREGVGIDNSGSNSVTHIKVANASTTGFTIAIYDTSQTFDVFIDWLAIPKTQ